MADSVQVTAERIRALQVQGARNVAIAAIQAFQTLAQQTKVDNKNSTVNGTQRGTDAIC